MNTLEIIIEIITETDYDGIETQIKKLTGKINGKLLNETYIEDISIDDTTAKNNLKNKLIEKGYSWDNEI